MEIIFISFLFYFFILCVGILPACMSHHVYAVHIEVRRGSQIHIGLEVQTVVRHTLSAENLGPLEEQPVLSTSELALWQNFKWE